MAVENNQVNNQKREIDCEVSPEDGVEVWLKGIIKQAPGDDQAIDNSDDDQWAHAQPFALAGQRKGAAGIAQDNRADEMAEGDRRLGGFRPDTQRAGQVKEEDDPNDQISEAGQECQDALEARKGKVHLSPPAFLARSGAIADPGAQSFSETIISCRPNRQEFRFT